MSTDFPHRSQRPIFRPQKARASHGLRRGLTLLFLICLVVLGLAGGWMLYVTKSGSPATAAVEKTVTAAPPPAAPAKAPAKPEAPAAKPPLATASLENPAPVKAPSLPASDAAPTAKAAPMPPVAEPAPPARMVKPASDGGGTPLVYCYQGKVPDSRLLVVDKSRQRLVVLRYMGEMSIEYEYPCSTGMQTGNKETEGDERTPEGIYFTTHRFEDRKITIFGDRAIHIDYPNAFDQCANKDGNGIFLHGTDKTLKPRASNGCVVMRNEDLALVAGTIKDQFTPIIVVDRLVLPKVEERVTACDFLQKISLSALQQAEARLGPQISLLTPPPQKAVMNELDTMGQRLAGFDMKDGKVEAQTLGLAIFGLGGNWVLVADQRFHGPKKEEVNVVRRFYLSGEDLAKASLVQGQWVVADTPQARLLASWAPPLPPPPPAPAPTVVASAKETAPAPAPAREHPAPAAPAAKQPPPAAPAPQAAKVGTPEEQLRHIVAQWAKAWESKNLGAYISFYAADFKSQGMDREAWRQHKAYLNNVYKIIGVEARDVRVEIMGTRARVVFVQHYRSDWHRDVGRKTLDMVLRGGHWQISGERWEAMPGGRASLRQAAARS